MENQYMHDLIANFSKHLKDALEIGAKATFNKPSKSYTNILVCGLGGSGIGGTIVQKLLEKELTIPFLTNKGYHIPAFVDHNSLVICCSYSGNTEETLAMYDQAKEKGAEVAVVCSGGKFQEIASRDKLNHIVIPGGLPPRAAFGLALPQLFFVLEKYGLISNSFISDFTSSIQLLDSQEEGIRKEGKDIANHLSDKVGVLYAESRWEGMLVRFRQQINENSKNLAWHHVIPELNHNELVGWRNKTDKLAVVLFRDKDDYYRNQKRFDYTKKVVQPYTPHFKEVHSKGASFIEKTLYFIHLGDWASFYLADQKGTDSVEVDIITGLKNMLSELD